MTGKFYITQICDLDEFWTELIKAGWKKVKIEGAE